MVNNRDCIKNSKRWVIKIGSALLTDDGSGLDKKAISLWVEQIVRQLDNGIEIIIVSSGAVAEGMSRLNWIDRPKSVHGLQVAAAVGQAGLIQAYESQFQEYDRNTAQILLDHDDISNRERYLNVRNTLQELIKLGVVPVINENDTVATDQIRFGDNDTLAALVANIIDADLLVILTDQDGLFDADPRKNPNAELVSTGNSQDQSLYELAGSSSTLGRGGMITKLKAAKLAARSGANTIIAGGRVNQILSRLSEGETLGTMLISDKEPIAARKQWLVGRLKASGSMTLDLGASKMLTNHGKSLLPVGVLSVQGTFHKGDLVTCIDEKGLEIARGLVNYSSEESAKILGKSSEMILDELGYCDAEELIHRDNLVLC
jgi:glutamate 5-kinase|tara:strand:+ start:7256 stop:8380 length:1125 start_codon:yes stop_codon:yes gene_type:complete